MITVAGTRRLKTAKGSLSLFWYLHPYFRGKPVLADQSYSMEALPWTSFKLILCKFMPVAQPDGSGERSEEGTTPLSMEGTVGRQISKRSSMRETSTQKEALTWQHHMLHFPSQPIPFFTSFSFARPWWRPERRWILAGVLHLTSGSTLLFFPASPPQQHSTRQQHPPSSHSTPLRHRPSSPSPLCCGLTQRNLKIRCDVWIPAKTESETLRLVRKPKKHMALILLSHSS